MPEPILTSIAAALATKAATGLYELVKRKFSGNAPAVGALEAAEEQPEDPQALDALAERLTEAENDDPEFATALRAEWQSYSVTQQTSNGGVANQISGNVSGKALQAGDIHGDVNF